MKAIIGVEIVIAIFAKSAIIVRKFKQRTDINCLTSRLHVLTWPALNF